LPGRLRRGQAIHWRQRAPFKLEVPGTTAKVAAVPQGELLGEGQTVAFNGHRFVIEKVEKRRITRVRMETTGPVESEV